MRFEDTRTEWRINDIERSLNGKADSHRLDQTNGDVDRLECALRELSSLVDGLRSELQTCQGEIRNLELELSNLQ